MSQLPTAKSKRRASPPDKRASGAIRPANKVSRIGRPTKHQSEELGSRILDTAASLFAAQGFAATSMEQIALACGAGKDTVYRRYPTKAALFAALMARLHRKLIPELDQAINIDKDPLEKVRHYARVILSINLRSEFLALNRVALGEAMASGGVKPIPVREDPVMKRFAELVEGAMTSGDLVEGDPYFIAEQLLYTTSIKPLISKMIGENTYCNLPEQDEYFKKAWDRFLAGAAPRHVGSPSRAGELSTKTSIPDLEG